MIAETITETKCFHCGQDCQDEVLWLEDKPFCCYGCKTVFEILNANDLCEYYNLEERSHLSLKDAQSQKFDYLDDEKVRKEVVSFDSETFSRVTFFAPAIHCISCIWLLENLQKINAGIIKSQVHFTRREVTIDFKPDQVKLSELARLIASVGYTPQISLDQAETPAKPSSRSLIYKLSVAGFVFGNVMLFSFPEYLGLDKSDYLLMRIFSWLNLILSIPVLIYSASDYFTAASKSFRQRQINIDVPIALGLLALFFRSSYDIISATGPGYLDSFTGLVFFLLIGRWFQGKTYESLAFDRDFKSYFPLAVNRFVNDAWKPVVIYELEKGDVVLIRNLEVIPCDCRLLDDVAYVDYSFVTGESRPVKAKRDDNIYAGGRLIGAPVRFLVEKKTSQSQLTSLWNNDAFKKVVEGKYQKIIDRAARRFTWIVMGIAVLTAVYWQMYQPAQMWLVLTSVLMVACPCALALAAPFTYGTMLRVFGRNNFYLKNADVIERLATVDAVVFDKTGTITHGDEPEIEFIGNLEPHELAGVKVLTGFSTHPLSQLLFRAIHTRSSARVSEFKEIPGKGLEGVINGNTYRIGSNLFAGAGQTVTADTTNVFVSINDMPRGYYAIRTAVRKNIKDMLSRLGQKCVALLSGDNKADRVKMAATFGSATQLLFDQSPQDKMNFVKNLQAEGKTVAMIGDGLNDAGALTQSDVGIAITDNTGVFTPACDAILQGSKLSSLDKFFMLAKSSTTILKTAFAISFLYNAVALTFAVTGHLTPLVAAVLMPLSSISVVGFSSLAVNYVAQKNL